MRWSGLEPVTTNGLGHGLLLEARDQRFGPGDGALHLGQRERRPVARLIDPHLSDPNGVRICRISRHHVGFAAGHVSNALEHDGDQRVTSPDRCLHSSDQSVHGASVAWGRSRLCCQKRRSPRAPRSLTWRGAPPCHRCRSRCCASCGAVAALFVGAAAIEAVDAARAARSAIRLQLLSLVGLLLRWFTLVLAHRSHPRSSIFPALEHISRQAHALQLAISHDPTQQSRRQPRPQRQKSGPQDRNSASKPGRSS